MNYVDELTRAHDAQVEICEKVMVIYNKQIPSFQVHISYAKPCFWSIEMLKWYSVQFH